MPRLYPRHQRGLAFVCAPCTALIICERNKRITEARILISVRPAVKSRGCASHCVVSVWLLPWDCPADAGVLGSFWFLLFFIALVGIDHDEFHFYVIHKITVVLFLNLYVCMFMCVGYMHIQCSPEDYLTH